MLPLGLEMVTAGPVGGHEAKALTLVLSASTGGTQLSRFVLYFVVGGRLGVAAVGHSCHSCKLGILGCLRDGSAAASMLSCATAALDGTAAAAGLTPSLTAVACGAVGVALGAVGADPAGCAGGAGSL